MGVLMGEFRLAFNLLDATVEVLRPMPSSAIIPIAILLLGIGNEMRISVVVFGALWPTIVSTVDSVRRVDTVLIDTGRTLNLTRFQVTTQIVVPAAAPGIATGMRISLAIALILALTVEMIAGGAGLGYYIIDAERSFRFADMYAGIIGAGILGYFVNRVFVFLEHRVLRWHYGFTTRER
jgi:ABC-type nitrate/sulfonate/bicarbonate transport system permease component